MLYVAEDAKRYENENSARKPTRSTEQYYVSLLECVQYRYEESCRWKRSTFSSHTLFFVLSGSLFPEGGGAPIDKNGVLFAPRFSAVEFRTDENTEFLRISFNCSVDFSMLKRQQTQVFQTSPEIQAQAAKLYQIACFHKSVCGVKEALLLSLLYEIDQYSVSATSELTLYRKACQWIEENAHRSITAEDVAASVRCSRAHLNRVFKSVDGCCLSNKITLFRLEKIQNLCRLENLSVADIARRLDFYSPELLCKFFKYHAGMSISEYRNAYRSGVVSALTPEYP